MDKISELPDELLVKILSFLPTKVAVSTSVLSKRWDFVWMLLPRLEYSDRCSSRAKCEKLRCFLDRNLPLHRAMVMESFCLKLGKHFKPEDIKLWVQVATSRYVRELEISYSYKSWENGYILSSSVYTCESLLILKLSGDIVMDVPHMACLPSLKSLQLEGVRYVNDESLQRLLSNCPVLDDLLVSIGDYDTSRFSTIIVPSLKRLSLYIPYECYLDEYVIDTPSLNDFKLICDHQIEPYIQGEVEFLDLNSLFVSVTSVKSLTICSKVVYGNYFTFNRLEHLKLCVCREYLLNLFVQFLTDSPKLRELDLFIEDGHCHTYMDCWNRPSNVPECLMSSLQTFKWSQYLGRPEERDIAVYILQNARRLETAKILADSCDFPNLEMLKELILSSRASTTCQLEFIED